MHPTLQTLPQKKLIGIHLILSLADNQTAKLWQSFMPRRKEIINTVTDELFSMQMYPPLFDFTFANFHAPFQKWAAAEVADVDFVPDGMERFTLPGGLYAVFHYKGLNTDPSIFRYIFGTWLPASGYAIDNRPHFELLGAKYKNNDPTSEEEIWIPIKPKQM